MPIDTTKNYRWKRVRSGRGCAKRSYRVKQVGSALLRFCCPKNKWRRGRCSGGMKLQAKAHHR